MPTYPNLVEERDLNSRKCGSDSHRGHMTKGIPKDIRSTMRKRARKTLFKLGVPYRCNKCGGFPIKIPADLPPELVEIKIDLDNRVSELQANHINKNLLDLDPVNLEWLCPACHKNADKVTAKNVSPKGDEHGYGI